MIEIMGLAELAKELSDSEVGHYSDSYNYVLFLKKMEDGSLKSYQMCVQGRDEEKDINICCGFVIRNAAGVKIPFYGISDGYSVLKVVGNVFIK